ADPAVGALALDDRPDRPLDLPRGVRTDEPRLAELAFGAVERDQRERDTRELLGADVWVDPEHPARAAQEGDRRGAEVDLEGRSGRVDVVLQIEDDARRIAQRPRDRLRERGMALADRERDRHRVRLLTGRDPELEARAVLPRAGRVEGRVPG